MKRDLEHELISWKHQKNRLPLLIRGARQIGKTYLVEMFGDNNFSNTITINFEYQPEFKQCFSTNDPREIVSKIELLTSENIVAGKTLLFFDEIQECPKAVLVLRYFKERLPDLHVIGAGSLLEFTLNDTSFRMPVGRIQYLYMYPMTFAEFLSATNHDDLRVYLSTVNVLDGIEDVIHEKLLSLLRLYMTLGGMPAVIREYVETGKLLACQRQQTSIRTTYRNDFGKYSRRTNVNYVQRVYDVAPGIIGRKIKYSDVDAEARSRDIKDAINRLSEARILHKVYASSVSGLPLRACINEKKYKLLFLDIGLINNADGLSIEVSLKNDIMQINKGVIAEQFVGQELLGYASCYNSPELYYWQRDARGSSAEVDYVLSIEGRILPIEVKSGSTGKMRSLRMLMKSKNIDLGLRLSLNALSYYDGILSIPLYMIEQVPRLVESVCEVEKPGSTREPG